MKYKYTRKEIAEMCNGDIFAEVKADILAKNYKFKNKNEQSK